MTALKFPVRRRAPLSYVASPVVQTTARGTGRLRAILAPAGTFPLPPCTTDRAKEVVEELRQEADYVIFDGPPMQSVGDAYLLLASVDMLVEVIRLERSTATSVIESQKVLERMPPPKVELVVTGA